jgi:hypothetical protein
MSTVAVDGDRLLERLDATIRFIVDVDLPDLSDEDRERLIGHLTGATFVTATRPSA